MGISSGEAVAVIPSGWHDLKRRYDVPSHSLLQMRFDVFVHNLDVHIEAQMRQKVQQL